MLKLLLAAGLLGTGLMGMAGAAVAQPKKASDLAKFEQELRGMGHLPLRGLAPPDPLVAQMTWQQMPMAGVPAAQQPMRAAIRAERLGEFDAARAAWAAIAADAKADPVAREEALLAAVRLNVTHDPAAARTALGVVPPALRQSVGVRMLEARLLLVEGKAPEAVALLSGELAPAIRLGRMQGMQLMTELMIAASVAGDRPLSEKMAGWTREALATGQLQLALPRCSADEGLLPGDSAVVDVGVDMLGQLNRATPVWASRAGPMAERLAARALAGRGNAQQVNSKGGTPLRVLVQLACAPHDVVPEPAYVGPAAVELGPDGLPRPNSAMAKLKSMAMATSPEQALEALEEATLPLDLKVAMLSQFSARMGDRPDNCGSLERTADLKAALAFPSRLLLASALVRCKAPETAARVLQAAVEDEALSAADRRAAAARATALTRDPELRARMAVAAELAPNSCLLIDDQALKGLVVEAEDFPEGLRRQNVEGRALIVFDRAANGEVSGLRSLAGQPPLLFDEGNRALLKRNPPLPPQRDGRGVACSGHVAGIRWSLQQREADD